ncbi:unnamed protein product [Cuscuta epithymum]|uniref:Replication factor A C-terminal domain-containing protein n=1 Tax=Cuscuta epithymum TaxID=186058 RepID=A0AAV0DR69_9ASTE|nr:unnamed protein product [Cuscuta epithymum]
MAAEMLLLDVKPETQRWTCRLTVIEKQNVRSAKNSPCKFMPIVLLDSAGTKVKATAFEGDIEGIDKRLTLYSTYLISNAYVKPLTELRYCVDESYKYVWSFTRRTMIQDVDAEEGNDAREQAEADTKQFWELYTCYLTDEKISILAAIVAKLPRAFIVTDDGQKVAWDVVVVDEDCTPLPLTMWGDFVVRHGSEIEKRLSGGECPLVLISKVAINLFQGLTLSTRFDSHMVLDPTGERALLLKKWVAANAAKIELMVVDKKYEHALRAIACPASQPRTTISCVETQLNTIPIVWVYGKLNFADTSGDGSYVGCDYCNRRVHGIDGVTFECLFCGQKQGTSVKRYVCSATLSDSSGCIPVTLFTSDILHLMEIVSMDPNVELDLEALDAKLQSAPIIAGVRRSKSSEGGLQKNPYSIVLVSNGKAPPAPAAARTATSSAAAPEVALDAASARKRKLDFKSAEDVHYAAPTAAAKDTLPTETTEKEPLSNVRQRKRKPATG